MNRERYVLISLFGLAPLLVWVLHFAFIYLAQQFICNYYDNNAGEGDTLVKMVILVVSIFIIIALAVFIVRIPELLTKIMKIEDKPQQYSDDTVMFMNYITMAFAAFSVIAIIWSTVSVIFLNACSVPY